MFEKVYGKDALDQDYGVRLKGQWEVILTGPDGKEKDRIAGPNVVCTNGKEFLASFLYSAAVAASTFTMKYVAIGTDATAEAAGNTALGTELARQTGTVSYVTGQIYRVTATFASGLGTGSIVEYGIFSTSTGGTLLNRTTKSSIAKGANDTLTAVLNLTIS